jgi:glutamyl/glutaminyl-tRNA synthetase
MARGGALIYRGRIAPTPSGFLHVGHALTFWTAFERAQAAGGVLIFRDEDLDPDRCRAEFAAAAVEDLRWLGIDWREGPDVGGPHAPYRQSHRLKLYRDVWSQLHSTGAIYPSPHSRKDVQEALVAPHEEIISRDEAAKEREQSRTRGEGAEYLEPIFPPQLRPMHGVGRDAMDPGAVNWRFRVPDDETVVFVDRRVGRVERVAGRDFGDFVVWRKDGFPSYELAVVADDHAMQITEVVRGEDLLTSTARQLLLYRALGWPPPEFYHCPLVTDAAGHRLAKRHDALTIRALRDRGVRAMHVRGQREKPSGPAVD